MVEKGGRVHHDQAATPRNVQEMTVSADNDFRLPSDGRRNELVIVGMGTDSLRKACWPNEDRLLDEESHDRVGVDAGISLRQPPKNTAETNTFVSMMSLIPWLGSPEARLPHHPVSSLQNELGHGPFQ